MEPVDRDMELLSNSMATYAHITGKHTKKQNKNAERFSSPSVNSKEIKKVLYFRFCLPHLLESVWQNGQLFVTSQRGPKHHSYPSLCPLHQFIPIKTNKQDSNL